MKFLQELTALSAAVYESIKELDLTPSQNRAIEREISDLLSAGKSQDIDVEVHHVQDEGDCYKAFYTFEDPKTGKDRSGAIYFKARILDHSVEDFEEKSFNEGLALKEGRGPQKKLWTILLHPEDGAPGAKPYPKAQVNKLVKYLSRKGVVNVLQNDAKNLKLHVAFNDSWTEDSVWDMIQSADLDDALSWGGSVRAAKKLAEDFEEKSFNEGLTSESRSFREEPIPPFAVCYSYDGVVHKDDVFMGSRAECLKYMRTHKAKKPFTFDLMDTDSGRLVSYSLKESKVIDDESLNESFARTERMLRYKMISRVEGFFGVLQSLRYDQLETEDLAKIFFTLVEKNLVKSVIVAGFGEVAKAEDLERFLGA